MVVTGCTRRNAQGNLGGDITGGKDKAERSNIR